MPEPLEIIRRAIVSLNRHRSPEATAEFVAFNKHELQLRFTGIFCQTCGVLDYFEDFIYELDPSAPIELTIIDFEQENENSFLVRYRITHRQRHCTNR